MLEGMPKLMKFGPILCVDRGRLQKLLLRIHRKTGAGFQRWGVRATVQ